MRDPNIKKLFDAIHSLREGMHFELKGPTYEDLVWHDERTFAPTKQEVEAEIERLNSLQYQQNRSNEYPPMADFLDAWVKQDQQALESYRQRCLDVKNKYPKT